MKVFQHLTDLKLCIIIHCHIHLLISLLVCHNASLLLRCTCLSLVLLPVLCLLSYYFFLLNILISGGGGSSGGGGGGGGGGGFKNQMIAGMASQYIGNMLRYERSESYTNVAKSK